MISVDASEVHDLASDFRAGADRTTARAHDVVEDGARQLTAGYRRLVPVLTSKLKDSMSTDVNGLSLEGGPTASYGDEVEQGTSDTPTQAALGPSFDMMILNVERDLGIVAERILT